MKNEEQVFRIGTLAEKLQVERFVIRFWEKEFSLKPNRTTGKQRFYTVEDLHKFTTIKELLYNKGLTIAGAKKHFAELKKQAKLGIAPDETAASTIIASQPTTMDPQDSPLQITATCCRCEQLADQLRAFKEKLLILRQTLS